jgi:hypothetical protein
VIEGEWLTLAETVRELGKSQSTVERLVGSGALKSKLEPREGRKPERLYSAEDVRRFAGGAEPNTRSVGLVKSPPETRLAIVPDAISAVREVMTEWRNQPPPISIREKLWLTLDEAAELSGLSAGFLRDSMVASHNYREGENLIGIKAGPHGAWRIQRASLEAFAG